MKTLIAVLAAVVGFAGFGADIVWTGADNACWTNELNWMGGAVPGAEDTAVFGAVGASAATTIDVTDMTLCKMLKVTGATAPKYTFGTATTQALRFPIESNASVVDNGIVIEASVPVANAPVFVASIGGEIRNPGTGSGCYEYLNIANNCAGEVIFNNFSGFTRATGAAGSLYVAPTYRGSGPSRVLGTYVKDATPPPGFVFEFGLRGSGKVTLEKTLSLGRLYGEGAGDIMRELELLEGVTLQFGGNFMWIPRCQMWIHGAGDFRFTPGKGTTFEASLTSMAYTNRVDVPILASKVSTDGISARYYGGGTILLTNEGNDLGGAIEFHCSGNSDTFWLCVAAPHIGKKGEASCLGPNVTAFHTVRNGCISYTGSADDVCDRDFFFSGSDRYVWGQNSRLKISQDGSGTITHQGTFSSAATAPAADLYLGGQGSADGILESVLEDQTTSGKALTLTKVDSSRWILKGANTFTGATSVRGGTLALGTGGTLESTPIKLSGGSVFEVLDTTARTFLSLENTSGNNTLRLAAGADVTITAFDAKGGTLAIEIPAGAKLTVGAITQTAGSVQVTMDKRLSTFTCAALAGEAPAWLFRNGKPAEFDVDGKLVRKSVETETNIEAHGGVIPNDATKGVAIATAGEGEDPVTLAANATAVAALAQKSSTAAVVSMPDQTLTTTNVALGELTADLTIGTTAGEGTLAGTADEKLVLINQSEEGKVLTVNAAISAPKGVTLTEKGDVVFGNPGAVTTPSVALAADSKLVLSNETDITQTTVFTGGEAGRAQIVKRGEGKVVYTAQSPDYSGDYVLEAGTNEISFLDLGTTTVFPFGKDGALYVTNGATLFVNDRGKATNASKHWQLSLGGSKKIHFSGTGASGSGALIMRDYHSALMYKVYLDGDTLFKSEKGSYVEGYIQCGSFLDMQQHDLTVRGHCSFVFPAYTSILNGGRIDLYGGSGASEYCKLAYYHDTNLGTGTICLHDHTLLQNYKGEPQNYTIMIDSADSSYNCPSYSPVFYADTPTNSLVHNGPIVFAPSNTGSFRYKSPNFTNMPFTIAGPVSGPGRFLMCGSNSQNADDIGHLYLANPTNTFTGGVLIQDGKRTGFPALELGYPGSAPNYSELAVTNARIIAHLEHPEWTSEDVLKLAAEAKVGGTMDYAVVSLRTDFAPDNTVTLSAGEATTTVTEPSSKLVHEGPGAINLQIATDWSNGFNLGAYNGTLALSGPGSVKVNDFLLRAAVDATETPTVVFSNGVHVTLAQPMYIGSIAPQTTNPAARFSRVKIENASFKRDPNWLTDHPSDMALCIGKNSDSIVEIGDKADAQFYSFFGSGNGHAGIYQTGGTWDATCGASWNSINWLGLDNYGYYHQSGGTFSANQFRLVQLGYAALRQTGGTSTIYELHIGRQGGLADWVVGGDAQARVTGYSNLPRAGADVYNITSVMTLEGNAVVNLAGTPTLAAGLSNACAIINLNGGRLEAISLIKYSKQTWMKDWESNRIFVNFNGGTFAPTAKDYTIFGRDASAVSNVTVYAGGATIDTTAIGASGNTFVDVALKAPVGLGVSSVAFSGDEFGDVKLVGPPGVLILGDGEGATALAEYDAATMKMTGVRVTCPGQGYTWAKAVLDYGSKLVDGTSGRRTNDCVLTSAAAASGSLVKKGVGTLRLAKPCTYGGSTVVKEGTLKLGCANAIPSGSEIVLDGGTIDFNGFTPETSLWRFDLSKTVSVTGNFAFPSGASVTIDNLASATEEEYVVFQTTGALTGPRPTLANESDLPAGYKFVKTSNALKVRKIKGLLLILR